MKSITAFLMVCTLLLSVNFVFAQVEELEVEGRIKTDRLFIDKLPAFRTEIVTDFNIISTPNIPLEIDDWIDSPILGHQTVFDNGENFDPATGIFTAPRSGIYFFNLQWHFITEQAVDEIIHSYISVNESVNDNCLKGFATLFSAGNTLSNSSTARLSRSTEGILKLNTGDTVRVYIEYIYEGAGFQNFDVESYSSFSGYLISDFD